MSNAHLSWGNIDFSILQAKIFHCVRGGGGEEEVKYETFKPFFFVLNSSIWA